MRLARRSLLRLLLASFLPGIGFAQSPPSAQPAPLPKDPTQLMQLAWQQNGLHLPDLQPWHVRATWQLLDDKGKPEKQGTWEEWWISPRESKTVYDSPDFQRTYWSTAQGSYTLEGHGSEGWIEEFVGRMIQDPVAAPSELGQAKLKASSIKVGGVELDCVTATNKESDLVGAFCFDPGLPALRARLDPALQIMMNSIVRFQGRYLARNIYVSRVGMPPIEIRLDQIDGLSPEAANQLTPSPQARFAPLTLSLSGGVIAGRRLSGDLPEYPNLAKADHVQGTVVLGALIGTDGMIHDLEVIAGPRELQQSAVDAVKTWKYQPYLLNGKPVDVRTQVNVVYHLSY